jgi:2'-5' RNA ligase
MRLFVAVEISDAVRDALAAEQQRLASVLRDRAPRFIRPEQIHFTLVFIGPVADERCAAFESAMTMPIAQRRFEIAIGGVGVFPARGAPRILWVSARRTR